jgi:hypothetical protein
MLRQVGKQHGTGTKSSSRYHSGTCAATMVDRRLAAGELDDLGLALGGDEAVKHEVDLLARERIAIRLVTRIGEADWAVEVAGGVDLDQCQAGVLLVLRAEAAVKRAPVSRLGLEFERERPRLVEAQLRHVELGVGVDKRLERSVLGAALAQHELVLPDVDLDVDDPLAERADRPRQLEEDLVAGQARWIEPAAPTA